MAVGDQRQRGPQSLDQFVDGGVRQQTPVEDDPRQRRETLCLMGIHQRQQHVGAVGRHDHHLALGQPIENVLSGHAADHDTERFTAQQFRVATVDGAFERGAQFGHGRRRQQWHLGKRERRNVGVGQPGRDRLGDLAQPVRIAAVGDHRCRMGLCRSHFGYAPLRDLSDVLRVTVVAVDGQHQGRPQVHRDPGVEAQLARVDDVGVVAADYQYGVTLPGDIVESRDDLAQCRFPVGEDLLVGHAAAGTVVVDGGGRMGQQQFELPIGLVQGSHDRPEDPDPGR